MELNKKNKGCKSIILRTLDATADADRNNFTFNNMPLIQILRPSILKVNSVSVGGEGHEDISNHNITVKLDNVKYNRLHYFNSDNDSVPTIANFDYSTKNTVQNGEACLYIDKQDINTMSLRVFTDSKGTGDPSHGLAKNSKLIELFISLTIEELDEY